MKRPFFARIPAYALILALLLTVAACQTPGAGTAAPPPTDPPTEAKTESPATPEAVTLTFLIGYGQNTPEEAAWYMAYLRENLGIEVEFAEGVTLDALIASRELPDIVGFPNKTYSKNAAEAGLLVCLDDNQDKLPNLFGSAGHFEYAIKFSRETLSDDTRKLYVMPTSVGPMDYINYDPQLRWDIYRQIGSPKIATLEDYLPVLKAMVDAYPQTEGGQKTYGLSLFPAWDGRTMANATYISVLYGVDSEYACNLFETPVDGNGAPVALLDDASQYKRVLKLFYDANQMGILDPDSATQTWDSLVAKWDEGRVMFSPWEWSIGGFNVLENTDAEDFKGYASVWPEDAKQGIFPDAYVGRDWSLAIGAATKNADAALRFFDFFYSFEGMDYIANGPQGVIWDIGADGMRYITDAGWDILEKQDGVMPGGGKLSAATGIINTPSFSWYTVLPGTPGQTLRYLYWESTLAHNPTKLQVDWRAVNGGNINSLALAKATNRVIKSTQALQMVVPPEEDLNMVMNQIGDVIKTASWQMVFAENDAKFESIWAQAKSDAEGLGMASVTAWFEQAWADAQANAGKYQP